MSALSQPPSLLVSVDQIRIKAIRASHPEMNLGAPLCQIFQITDGFKMSYIMYDVINCSTGNQCLLTKKG